MYQVVADCSDFIGAMWLISIFNTVDVYSVYTKTQ